MKTAISVPDDVFSEVERLARKYECSRSEVFVIAVRELIGKVKSKDMLKRINEAYGESESPEDSAIRKKSMRHYAKKVLKEPY